MSKIAIIAERKTQQYVVYTIQSGKRKLDIHFTNHAIDRITKWRLTVAEAIETCFYPDEVIIGHHDRFVAHQLKGDCVIRVVYEMWKGYPVVITVYVPRKERYYQGGGTYVHQILS